MADTLTSNFGIVKIEVGASLNSWGAKINTNMDDIDKVALGHYTIAGTANARTISTGLSLAAIPTGMQVRFLTATTNTGSTTLNVDGLGAVTCKTVTGADLPNGYIRANIVTVATYNGTNWIVEREIETATDVVRYANGTQICTTQITTNGAATASGNIFIASADDTWTFAQAFSAVPSVSGAMLTASRFGGVTTGGAALSASAWAFRAWTSVSNGAAVQVRLTAIGLWY